MAKMTNYEIARSEEIVKLGELVLNEEVTLRKGITVIQKRVSKLRDESGFYTGEALDFFSRDFIESKYLRFFIV